MSASVQVRRVLTTTPLARQHERGLAGTLTRRVPAIDWKAFDRSRYPEGALSLAAHAQSKLALGEYGAVDLFAHLASAMALLGVPFDLVAAAARTPADEIRHADYAMRAAELLRGRRVAIAVDADGLRQRWSKPVDMEQLDLLMLEVCAIGETLSCALLSACLERARDPVMHSVFSGIVSDEVHHARLGWYYFAWRAPQWSLVDKQRIADRGGSILVKIEKQFWRGRDAEPKARKAARDLGVLESKGQRAAVRAVMEDEIVPALDALGLGASHAWRVRERGQ
jgi:hypothetical protein